MTTARLLIGDVFDRLADIPDDSIDLVMTSPPFLALRSYLPEDHPDKHLEIGSEPTPAEFLDTMLALVAEIDRVVRPTGSIAIELGDTYSGSGGYSQGGLRDGQPAFIGSSSLDRSLKKTARVSNGSGAPIRDLHGRKQGGGEGWPLAKSMTLIPEMFRIGLAYGINPLTGEESPAGRWRVRNVVRWHRPNPPVGALGDKYRPATSDLVIACRNKDRWFDLDAVRTGHKADPNSYTGNGYTKGKPEGVGRTIPMVGNLAGAPPLDTWTIPTSPFKGSHYATYPIELCRIPILSMCPLEVCPTCGEPRRRIVENEGHEEWARHDVPDSHANHGGPGAHGNRVSKNVTVGWSDCDCETPTYQPGTVLDPFAGSGTTLAAAIGHGRNAIGIDLDERNAELARERIGMFLDIDARGAAA